jgi:hypothetical protein
VIGFKDGRFHDKDEHYDGATFGQILDSYIFPAVNYAWKAFEVKGASPWGGRRTARLSLAVSRSMSACGFIPAIRLSYIRNLVR